MIKAVSYTHLDVYKRQLIGRDKREYILSNAVDTIKNNYDFIIIDCPPSLNLITINALTSSDTVLVPIQCEYFALEGLEQLLHTIGPVSYTHLAYKR